MKCGCYEINQLFWQGLSRFHKKTLPGNDSVVWSCESEVELPCDGLSYIGQGYRFAQTWDRWQHCLYTGPSAYSVICIYTSKGAMILGRTWDRFRAYIVYIYIGVTTANDLGRIAKCCHQSTYCSRCWRILDTNSSWLHYCLVTVTAYLCKFVMNITMRSSDPLSM